MTLRSRLAALMLGGLALPLTACAHPAAQEEDSRSGFQAGLTLDTEPSARQVGLPIMPGATRRADGDGDGEGSGINFSAWAGVFGLKIVVLQLASPEPAERVADYYRQELARYGEVIDCSKNAPTPGPRRARRDADGNRISLDCGKESHARASGDFVLKTGTPRNFRLVNVEPRDGETHVNLVRIVARGD